MRTILTGNIGCGDGVTVQYSWFDAGPTSSTAWTDYTFLCPTNGTLHSLGGYVNGSLGVGYYVLAVHVEGVGGEVAMTLTDTNRYGRDMEHRMRVQAGQRIGVKLTPVNNPTSASRVIRFIITFESDAPKEQPVLSGNNVTIGATVRYGNIQGYPIWDAVESVVYSYWPTRGKFMNLYVLLGTAPGVGKSRTFTVYINGAATGLTLTISDPAVSGNIDYPVAVNPGDTVSMYRSATAGTTNSVGVWYGVTFSPEIDGEAVCTSASLDTTNPAAVEYVNLISVANFSASATVCLMGIGSMIFKKFYVNLSGAPGATAADGYTFDIWEVNAATALISLTLLQATTAANDTTTSKWTVMSLATSKMFDVIDIRVTPVGAANAVTGKFSCVRYLPPDLVNDYNLRATLPVGKNGGRIPATKIGRRLRKSRAR